ncbi:hypothetical protein FGG08_000473 [Glutinoglossum americanum]|uniref:Uncharacterized protein n=1 Tax=Glutinoglossum americanum TaxID=1670608 RepID=A0A9P8L6V3_9PEZI|nr:hypothetical protein FGG08_000473 [Glutinoglossum americanum]
MDGLRAAARVITVAQVSDKIFDLRRTYYLGVRDTREDIRRLRDEITSLRDISANVLDLAVIPGSAKLSIIDRFVRYGGPVRQCQVELKELVAKLELEKGIETAVRLSQEPGTGDDARGNHRAATLDRVCWVGHEEVG